MLLGDGLNPFVTSSVSRRKFLGASSLGAAALFVQPVFAMTSMAAPVNLAAGAARWIRPVIGSSTSVKLGEGKTFPGPCAPFGMVQLGPDTITGGDNASGYSYEHNSIEGFSLMRMSGVGWYGDFGNLMMMPTTGPLELVSGREVGEGWRSGFTHATETMEAGYYSVVLDKYDIRAELTAAARAGVLRFTYPKTDAGTGTARVQIDLARRIGGTSTRQYVKVVSENAIEGWVKCPEAGGGWGNGAGHVNYTLFYRVEFSKPLRKFGIWSVDMDGFALHVGDEMISDRFKTQEFYDRVKKAKVVEGAREMEGDHLGFYIEFATEKDEQVIVKVGVSFVDVDGARANLESEIGGKSFEAVRGEAVRGWDSALGAIEIEGATEKQRGIFATAMYHAMLDPRVITDVDGRYRAADGSVREASAFTPRTIFSGWDVFRGELPLMTILQPELVNDQICTLLEQADLSGRGYLERWEIMGAYSGCMDGDPATSVILDAYQKGIRKYDLEKAYAACRQTAAGVGDKTNRPQNDFYLEHGYVPEQVSWTLDNAYFDWCVGQLAKGLGKTEDGELFHERGQNYRKIYDPEVQSMRAKDAAGKWIEWKRRTEFGQGCTESNPLQQSWFVPHDVPGLIKTMGAEKFVAALEDMFEQTPETFAWNAYYNHSNEPVHHIPYLFVYAGKPWLTQKWARKIVDHAYGDEVNGIPGNDDVGQMSAWYVLSAMGFYPVCPGDGNYILGSPLFTKATIKLDRKWHAGGSFRIEAKNNSAVNCYIQSAVLNGKALNRAWIRHAEIVAGGRLDLVMGPKPNEAWGVSELPGMQA
jgi:predicted alpha-1,2-mannosidase